MATYALGEVCKIVKGTTGIKKASPGIYPLVVTAEERLSHNEYQFDEKAVCIPLVSSTGHGHASINRIHYEDGKFALGSILAAAIPKDEKFLNTKYLYIYLSYFKDSILVPLMKGGANVSLTIDKLKTALVEIPPLEKQYEIISLESKLNKIIKKTNNLLDADKIKLKQLSGAILQEAVRGKLVSQDSKDESAIFLFKKIKEIKENLIKSRQIKKNRQLHTITENEIPYQLPNGWIWCKLGDVCTKIGSGSTPKGSDYSKEGIPFFRSQNIYDKGLLLDDITYISDRIHARMGGTIVYANDILLNITGGSMGRSALVPNDFKEGNVSQHVCIIRPICIENKYLHYVVLSPYFQKLIFNSTTGAGREGLPKYNLEQFSFPLPPLQEQKRIVDVVSKIMKESEDLNQNINDSKRKLNLMMQSVLQGTFQRNNES